ncbi:hypothetical protein GW17_00023366 [Ensete ventricosum]|nr:hypothetical protein GW17_00023366 [Ensete ventricosum]
MIDGSRQQRDRESSTDSRFSLFLSLFFFLPWLIPPEIGSKSIKRTAAAIYWKSSEMRKAALSGPLETDTESLTGGQDYYGKETECGGDPLEVIGDEGGGTVDKIAREKKIEGVSPDFSHEGDLSELIGCEGGARESVHGTTYRWRSTTAEERGGRLERLADQGETRGEIVEPNRTRGPGSVGP